MRCEHVVFQAKHVAEAEAERREHTIVKEMKDVDLHKLQFFREDNSKLEEIRSHFPAACLELCPKSILLKGLQEEVDTMKVRNDPALYQQKFANSSAFDAIFLVL